MLAFLMGALTGMAFGIVLYKVGATRYSRVMGMLTLRDTKVMKFAFTAIAVSSLWYGLAAVAGVAESWNLVPRIMPFIGFGHVVGGVLFGASLGFAGFCPGTCVAKVGGGAGAFKFASQTAVAGLVAGVVAYLGMKDWLTEVGVISTVQKPMTLHGLTGIPYGPFALAWAALFFVIAALVDRITPEKAYAPARVRRTLLDYVRGEWTWLASGAVGGTVIVAATAQGGYLGFSGSLLALVGWVAHLIGTPIEAVPVINDDILWRVALILGVLPGGLLASAFSTKSLTAATSPAPMTLNPRVLVRSFTGGFGLALGAMIGGGCTTGAFIAAWSTLSVGSLAMAGTFFAVSMIVANLLYFTRTLDLSAAQATGDRVYD